MPVQAFSTRTGAHVLLPNAQPPSRDCIHQESHPPFPASHALVSFLNIIPLRQGSFVAAVKTETFYGVYKPEVTQLNETICHIKFTSAGIKRQIT